MSTEEPKPESPASSDAKAEAGSAGESPSPNVDAAVAWPPPEAAPSGEAGATQDAKDASQPASTAPSGNGVPAAVSDSGVMTAPEPAPKPAPPAAASGDDMPAATPQEEMGLSNSTLHWLEDGEQAVPGRLTEPGSMPSYDPRAPVPGRKRGVLVADREGSVVAFALGNLQERAQMFVAPGDLVYEGMIAGENSRPGDLDVNVTKEKKLTNMRASGSDDNVLLEPPRQITLEYAMEYIEEDELIEVTPKTIRLRKRVLQVNDRKKAARAASRVADAS